MQPVHPFSSPDKNPAQYLAIPTGSLRLDILLGTGGIPPGHVTEVSGTVMSGKTTFCLHLIAAAQRQGGLCAWVDSDHALDPAYTIHCGVNPDRLYLVESNDAEQALSIVESLLHSASMALVIVDSVSSLVPHAELQVPLGKSPAKSSDVLLARALPILASAAARSGAALVLTSQSWSRSSPVYHQLRNHPEKLALKLHSALRLQINRVRQNRPSGAHSQDHYRIRCLKNKFTPDFRAIRVDIVYNETYQFASDIFDLSLAFSVIRLQESHYFFRDRDLGSSRTEVIEQLLRETALAAIIETVLRQQLVMKG